MITPKSAGYTCFLASRGYFVSFEGIDGSGKTTQLRRLADRLSDRGLVPILAQEPGGTRVGRMIRAILLDSANSDLVPVAELLLYFASRAQNIAEVIRPALEQGRLVLCDRFTDATVAYQGFGRALGADRVLRLSHLACDDLQPDLTLWLDIEPSVALERARKRNKGQSADEGLMEAQSTRFFEIVRRGYESLHAGDPGRIRRIDASGSVDQVASTVESATLEALEVRGIGIS